MISITVKEGELRPPVFISDKATSVELRDNEGNLFHFIVWMKSGNTVITSTKGEPDFEWNARVHNIPLRVNPNGSTIITLG